MPTKKLKKVPVDEYTTLRVKTSTAKRVRVFVAMNDCDNADEAIALKFADVAV